MNSGSSATATAGLCDQCHGITKNGTWTADEIGTIDQITGEALWVSGYNGHGNSVISASGGVGVASVQLAAAMGYTVVALSRSGGTSIWTTLAVRSTPTTVRRKR